MAVGKRGEPAWGQIHHSRWHLASRGGVSGRYCGGAPSSLARTAWDRPPSAPIHRRSSTAAFQGQFMPRIEAVFIDMASPAGLN